MRSGLGGSEDQYGYTYTVSFTGDYVRGNLVPLVAETTHDLSNPSYNGISGRNDLTFSGTYAPTDADEVVIFTVTIVDHTYNHGSGNYGNDGKVSALRFAARNHLSKLPPLTVTHHHTY